MPNLNQEFVDVVARAGADETFLRTVFWNVARFHPEILLEAANGGKLVAWPDTNPITDSILLTTPRLTENEFAKLNAQTNMVEAIKMLRAIGGLGLKESKDVCESWGIGRSRHT